LYQVSPKFPKGFRRSCQDNVNGQTDDSGIA
jgi:hypothetical protein